MVVLLVVLLVVLVLVLVERLIILKEKFVLQRLTLAIFFFVDCRR